ncbi:hypothetical protein [Homoserinibacter sp. GY 40078]|uniref:hypothetical protein n=1 Tax=Homoserinibacter sp. GY 40078 TaxID=2603275 RepID=UPI003519E706
MAQRLRLAAAARGLDLTPIASSASAAPDLVPSADALLIGAHLGEAAVSLSGLATASSVPFAVIDDVARQDGEGLLETMLAAVAAGHPERIS